MKTTIIIIILHLLFLFSLRAQSPLTYVFNNRDDISDGNADAGIKPYYWNHGILYLGYCYDSTLTHEGFTLTFYDTLGTKQWNRSYFFPSYKVFQGNDIISLNNSSFYIGGILFKDSAAQCDYFLTKFNSIGDSIFLRIYSDTLYSWLMDLEPFTNDTILLLGADKPNINSDLVSTIIRKIDSSGNTFSLYHGIYDLKPPSQIIKGPSKIYVGGTLKTAPGDNYNVKVFIKDFTLNLNFIGSHTIGNTMNEYFSGITILGNRLYITSKITVYNPPNPNSFYQCNIKKLTFNFYWAGGSQNYGPLDFSLGVGKAISLNDHLLIFPIYTGYQGTLYFIDSTLTLICQLDSFNAPVTEKSLGEFIVLPNKKIAGTGVYWQTNQYNSQDHWNFLTDNIEDYLNTTCLNNNPLLENKDDFIDFIVYPTLFQNSLTIKCKNKIDIDFVISFYNCLGKKIIGFVGKGEVEINTSMLMSGLYFIHIENNKKNKIFKIIKTE